MSRAAEQEEQGRIASSLAEQIGRGEREAEQSLILHYSRGLLMMLRHATLDDQLAEDLMQDTFVVVLQRLRDGGISDPVRLNGFIHATARNLLLNHRRKGARRATVMDTELIERTAVAIEDPTAPISRAELTNLVRDCLDDLGSPRDRDILIRFYLRDEDREQICAEHSIGEKHFYRVLCRARQRLRERLGAKGHADWSKFADTTPEG